jgi:predicted ATP-grasp superfamily ATP-dependent carboligase
MDNEVAVLIVAISGRALAASARRGGYRPLVADMFGDEDTLNASYAHVRLAGDLASGIEEQGLIEALEAVSEGQKPVGVVCGTGFEDRTQLLQRLAERWPLLGNGAEVVAKAKDPEVLSSMCADFAVPFPEISLSKPSNPDGWLTKRKGGAGGTHVKPVCESKNTASDFYYQRKVSGVPVAASFLAHGKRAVILGFSAQWSSPTPSQPYRYGGAVRPAQLAPRVADLLSGIVHRFTAGMSLVGLNSADFLINDERFWLLEINPRPGATLDIFETTDESLFTQHMAACTDRPVTGSRFPRGAKAAEIVYAADDILSFPVLEWPDWTTDRPLAGSTIKAGEPVCTVHARGSAVAGARALAQKRRETVLSWTRARNS